MARFFIDRPVFAMVIAIVTVIVGAVAIPNLPIATYPQVVPPVVQIIAVYRGGNSQDLEKTVAQPIEQRLVGLDGMLIWINPDKMGKLGLTATDVNNAIQAQNRQNPAGAIGQPPVRSGIDFQYPVNAAGRLLQPQQFGDIVVRAQPDGSLLKIRDIGRVELGAQDYKGFSRLNQRPASLLIVYLAPGANAVETAARVRAHVEEAKKSFPAGVESKISYDSTRFVRAAISDVVLTL